MNDHVWLRHREHGGYWQCPAGAVEEFRSLGWEPADPPEEVNPVVAERLAWEAAQTAKAEPTTSRKSGTKSTPQEG